MTYDKQILEILTDVGQQGIGVQQLDKHVYNLNNTMFTQVDLKKVHQYVQQYLLRNSRSPQSLIESTGRRGYYRLNTQNNADARQLMLQFREEQQGGKDEVPQQEQDFSLSLFD